MTPPDAAAFIRAHLPVLPVPGLPEIHLHKAVPASGVGRLAGDEAPYWAHYWAGGLALARYVLDHPERVAGRRVLDLGAGSGLVAIAAMKAGARDAIAIDADPHALAALALNAAANAVSLDIRAGDAASLVLPDVDMILIGDLFYSDDLAEAVTAFLDRCLDRGIEALVGDPWRRPLPLARLREVARYDVAETGMAPKPSGVFRFHRNVA
ncbi:class I SAM-dependent methyltransferase [Sphingopyxis panaciterrulae]|uniref:Putative nicotinamide N-methyase n=1 Tax=Sphingopyxis panaciterrulae TaxID=462372 RepID=A0A7W9B6F4_9SPHN|nr:50S ribosomal protein L11 methyltransferase [Sphingopyxis panaciterrulae]MBB5707125.1 putative nicotinamide N-methyase [Sphingopyxis panaciterrulae]